MRQQFFTKLLFSIIFFAAVIHAGAAPAAAQDSPAGGKPAGVKPVQPQPAPEALLSDTRLPVVPETMSADEFTRLMAGAGEAALTLESFDALRRAAPDLVVLDLRSREAYAARHIKGAVNMPIGEMTEHNLPAVLPDKTRPVVMVCDESFFPTRRVSMTLQAWPLLKANGYEKLYRLNLWRPAVDGGAALTREEIEQRVEFDGAPAPQNP